MYFKGPPVELVGSLLAFAIAEQGESACIDVQKLLMTMRDECPEEEDIASVTIDMGIDLIGHYHKCRNQEAGEK